MYQRSPLSRIAPAVAALLLSTAASQAQSFAEMAPYLDTDGSVVMFADFRGDGQMIGQQLNVILAELRVANPDTPPIPLDFPTLFDTLGFGSIGSLGASSKDIGDGLFRNRIVTYLQGPARGLMVTDGVPKIGFEAALIAPADAGTAASATFSLQALRDTLLAVATQVAGEMGRGFLDAQLQAPLPGTDLTGNEILTTLSAPVDFIMAEFVPGEQVELEIWLRLSQAGPLLPRLRPLLRDGEPVTITDTKAGLLVSIDMPEKAPFSALYILQRNGTTALEIYSSPSLLAKIGPGPDRLSDQAGFQRLAQHLPATAWSYSYSSGIDLNQLIEPLSQVDDMAPYKAVIRETVRLMFGGASEPQIAASYEFENGWIYDTYSETTYRRMLSAVAAVPIGLTAAMAVPAFQKVREGAQQDAIENNLRMISAAADQHMLDTGTTQVRVGDLIGPEGYLAALTAVAGESYEDLIIFQTDEEVRITLPDGREFAIPR